ncbi:PREDICTED: uncharacterized protein LOC106742188 [Dinoponera quadriceps]|uniref:Uncharacterized protein LOC106742188 n=1 Tax=Dinoponera quadriceps TaxID=609295 RepID=A0A6P3WWE9_DINQU|nr:PREDICTED: uncharacterized protein LOC106742188 [Dinoponera quadriceps]
MTGELLMLIFLVLYCRGDGSHASRVKRQGLLPPPIVYPFGGTFKLVVGFAVPVELSGRILVYGQNFQFQYALPPNATLFTEFFENASSSRRRRDSISQDERMTVYGLLEEEFERKGMDGRECMKKTICEAALAPLEDEGLVGELLHLFLTPQEAPNSSLDPEYLEALEFGRSNGNCSRIYRSCLPGQGILDQISSVIL